MRTMTTILIFAANLLCLVCLVNQSMAAENSRLQKLSSSECTFRAVRCRSSCFVLTASRLPPATKFQKVIATGLDDRILTTRYYATAKERGRRFPQGSLFLWPVASTKGRRRETISPLYASSLSWPSKSIRTNDTISSTTIVATKTVSPDVVESISLGTISRIRIEGQDDSSVSFVGAMGVPTYQAVNGNLSDGTNHEASEKHDLTTIVPGPAFVVTNVLSKETCRDIIHTCETYDLFQQYNVGKNYHGAMQIIVNDEMANYIAKRLHPHINMQQVEQLSIESDANTTALKNQNEVATDKKNTILSYAGINRRWRIYRYLPGGIETFAPHIDAGFPPSGLSNDDHDGTDNTDTTTSTLPTMVWDVSNGTIVSRLTLLMYLNDDFDGGETVFYENNCNNDSSSDQNIVIAVKPVEGSCLIFPQAVGEDAVDYARKYWPLHEGSPVKAGSARPKYVIRSDILFTKES